LKPDKYRTLSKENSIKSNEETNEHYEKSSIKTDQTQGKRNSKSRINPMKFSNFLNAASSYWSKQLCISK